jgi:hypothetical protein
MDDRAVLFSIGVTVTKTLGIRVESIVVCHKNTGDKDRVHLGLTFLHSPDPDPTLQQERKATAEIGRTMTVCHFLRTGTVSSDLIILNRFDAKISFRIRSYPQIPHNMHENYLLTRSFEKIVGHIIPEAEVPAVNVRYDVRLGLELAAAHTPQVRNQNAGGSVASDG